MTFISYAQNQEDVLLRRALKQIKQGFYVDVGAQDPVLGSVTKTFYDMGWRGINIEPTQEYYQKLVADRPEDINLNIAVSATTGELTLYEFLHTGLTTSNQDYAEQHHAKGFDYSTNVVPCLTLDAVFAQHPVPTVHFLKIDVEGHEKAVLAGCSFETVRPWILIIEATVPNSPEDSSHEWHDLVLSHNYQHAYFDGLNRYYVAVEHSDLLASFNCPPRYFDDYILFTVFQLQQEKEQLDYRLRMREAELDSLYRRQVFTRLLRKIKRLFKKT
jgi:FkbM family methyltransferase